MKSSHHREVAFLSSPNISLSLSVVASAETDFGHNIHFGNSDELATKPRGAKAMTFPLFSEYKPRASIVRLAGRRKSPSRGSPPPRFCKPHVGRDRPGGVGSVRLSPSKPGPLLPAKPAEQASAREGSQGPVAAAGGRQTPGWGALGWDPRRGSGWDIGGSYPALPLSPSHGVGLVDVLEAQSFFIIL